MEAGFSSCLTALSCIRVETWGKSWKSSVKDIRLAGR